MPLRRWLVTVLCCVVLVGGLGAYKTLQIRNAIAFAESFPEQSETIEVAVAQLKSWQPKVNALGEIVAPQSIVLRNELAGTIVELGFRAGETVKQGQLLLKQDSREEQARLDAAKAETELAQLAMKRYAKLLQQNASSKDRYDQAKSELAIAKANVKTLRAIIDKKTLLAPFDAFTGLHSLTAGQFLAANSLITNLVGIDQRAWIDFNLPQQQSGVSLNTPVQIVTPNLLAKPITGAIIAIDTAVMAQSRHLRFRAQVQDNQRLLKPGSLVEVSVDVGASQSSIMLPATAIRYDNFGSYIYRVDTNIDQQGNQIQRAKKQKVSLGPKQNGDVIVLSGLHEGDLVAANGAFKLSDGMLINIQKNKQSRQSSLP